MLTADVKRRIDTARDILVGKVPTPTAQVEQITIALIYKFMDDMDAQAEEFGGKRSFFSGEFTKYGWSKLLHSGLGGHEMLNLYAEAIAKMPENPGIPKLFREIFKNAFLPYRDPETLREFLKTIDGFTYDHSEDLGDAYEYLLSVLGSQGDAGQFRTPRHIIDFMVAIIDPKKDESILDPACGTAGFLISAYKHIMAANTDEHGVCTLTPDEKKRLAANIVGYDISPDMVRLSHVNMYLHGFVDPHIFEYDTLTSQEKWGEYANTIFANPPFMSPKGGIKPHNRFSIQSKRSEVLFVDYIAEHLTPTGRSAVIVPEGIIFQSQNAYKQLRKLLVEEYLVAVVSLPAGLFQPYSGVKTSILVMDKALARQRSTVAFFAVNNDGFGLGAQRRPIEQDDLPGIKAELVRYLNDLRAGKDVTGTEFTFGHVVQKEKIAASGEYNLGGERYRNDSRERSIFPLYSLGDAEIFQIESGGTPSSKEEEYWGGDINWVTLVDIAADKKVCEINKSQRTITTEGLKNSSAKILPDNSILVSSRATIGRIAINRMPTATNQGFKNVIIKDFSKAIPEYVAYVLTTLVADMNQKATGGVFKELSKTEFCKFEIPLPPLEVQKEIVAEIEGYQKIIDGARAVVESYRPQIRVDPRWPLVALHEVATLLNGRAYKESELLLEGQTPVLRLGNLFSNKKWYYSDLELPLDKYCEQGDLLYAWSASFGPHIWEGPRAIYHYHIWKVVTNNKIEKKYLYLILAMDSDKIKAGGNGIAMLHVTKSGMEKHKIPLPSLEIQQQIVAEIEAEQVLVNANKELIARFEKKIEAVLASIWEEAEESADTGNLGDFELPDAELQFPFPGREEWATDCIPCAIRQVPHRRFGDYYDAAALGTLPNLCTDLLPPNRAAELQALIQKTGAFANCEPGQRIRKELVQDALSEKMIQITPEGCSLPDGIVLEREDILTPIVPYLFEALEILRDVLSKASTSQRIQHLTPHQRQLITETWNQGAASAA